VITEDELAAIAAALAALEVTLTGFGQAEPMAFGLRPIRGEGSRWKYAARNPDLDIEDYRSV
jgi:hypothetical protein